MTYDELNEFIIEEIGDDWGDYAVRLDYCYIDKYNMPFDEQTSYEVFSYNGECIVWVNDWFEGQDYCSYSKLVSINDLMKAYERGVVCGRR